MFRKLHSNRVILAVGAALAWTAILPAHSGHTHSHAHGGFAAGLLHPLTGLDHLLAMLAVGLWAATLDRRAMIASLVAFPLFMVVGGALGMSGVGLPLVELAIGASSLAIGLALALRARPQVWLAAPLVAAFALFHGHAHGAELPAAATATSYAIGFTLATLGLHLAGLGLVALLQRTAREQSPVLIQRAGYGVAAAGVCFCVMSVL